MGGLALITAGCQIGGVWIAAVRYTGERGSWPERLLPHHYSRLISGFAHVVISYLDAIACMSFF